MPGNPGDVIRCSLRVVNLSDPHCFTALSYTWESDPNRNPPALGLIKEVFTMFFITIKMLLNFCRRIWLGNINFFSFQNKAHKSTEVLCDANGPKMDETSYNAVNQDSAQRKPEIICDINGLYVDKDPCNKINQNRKKTIICDGHRLDIGENLHNAMLEIRKVSPGQYWIDQICINQDDDDDEKKNQVQMMGEIYSCAKQVIVWLGECPTSVLPVVDQFCGLRDKHQELEQLWSWPVTQSWTVARNACLEKLMLLWIVYGVTQILRQRWFQRIWVVQEICFSQRTSFIFGHCELTKTDLEDLFTIVQDVVYQAKQKLGPISAYYSMFGTMDSVNLAKSLLNLQKPASGNVSMTIEQWLELSRSRQSGLAVDLVFGGLTLIDPRTLVIDQSLQSPPQQQVNDSNSLQPPQESNDACRLWPSITIDYNIKFPELSLNLAACLLSRPRSIDLLTIAARSRQWLSTSRPKMPTWDVITGTPHHPIQYKLTKDLPSWYPVPWTGSSRLAQEFPLSFGTSRFRACTSLANKPRISADGKSLFLDAAIVDTLECPVVTVPSGDWMEDFDISKYLNPVDFSSSSNKRLFTEGVENGWLTSSPPPFHVLDFILGLPNRYEPTGQNKLDALCNLFTASIWDDSDLEGQPPGTSGIDKITGFCQYLTDWVNHHISRYAKELPNGPDPRNPFYYLVKDKKEILTKLRESFSTLKEKNPEYPWPHEFGQHPDYPWPEVGEYAHPRSAALAIKYGDAQKRAQRGRSVFTTTKGYLVLAPDSASKGDTVMLVKGGCVPYVFTHIDNHLREIITQYAFLLRHSVQARKSYPERSEEAIEAAFQKGIQLIKKTDGWILTGEAYVEGFMHGEGVGLEFGRIKII